MDLLCFDALVGSMDRVVSLEKISNAWLNMASAQATIKGMKGILKPMEKRISKNSEDTSESAANFANRLKKGFK